MAAIPPPDYYIPTLPGKGILINGQFYRLKYGPDTHEMMVNDGAFEDNGADDQSDELARLTNELTDSNDHIDLLQRRIFELVTQLKEAGITPRDPGPDSERGDLEQMEDGSGEGGDDEKV